MLASLLLVLAQAATPSAPAEDVVVIGRRAEEDLAGCLARSCPPAEEVEASLQAPVEQFVGRRYRDARRTLQQAIRRNRDHAAEMPGPVSSLYATLATVAEHEGDPKLWLVSARNNVLVLRQHLGAGDSATLAQELVFADTMIGLNQRPSAEAIYRRVQQTAAQNGQLKLAGGAAFRRAWLELMARRDKEAIRLADEAVAIAGADNRLMIELRDILQMRIALRRGDEGAVDALAERLRQSATEQPRLLFAPPIEDINADQLPIEKNPAHDSGIRIADVGYWIRPDGRTAEAEVLGASGLGQWKTGILQHISRRRYAALAVEPGDPGIYHIDRFTVRGTIGIPTGSRIPMRMGNLTVHIIDLTETDAMSAANRKRTIEATARHGA